MTRKIFRFETILYAAAFLLALTIRLASIGRIPLSDSEAQLALQALALSKGQDILLSGHPAYILLTTVWIFLFGSSHWTARFWPALAGSVLVVCPILFKRYLGQAPALILAFILAIDPAFLAISIQAGSPVFGLLFLTLCAGMLLSNRSIPAGIAAGLALLAGPSIWLGVVSIGLALLAARSLKLIDWEAPIDSVLAGPVGINWRIFTLSALAAFFAGGTLFFVLPGGLGAAANSLAAFLSGWQAPLELPGVSLVLTGLLVYEFLLLFLGIWGSLSGLLKNNLVDKFLLIWWLAALLLILLYPGRQMADLIWSLVPLAALASRQAERILTVIVPYDRLPVVGQAVLTGLILGFLSLTVFAMVNNPQFFSEQEYWLRLGGGLMMLIASTGLIAWGWSKEVAWKGLAWGLSALLVIYTVAAAWDITSLSSRAGNELWAGQPVLPEEEYLLQTISQLNQWSPEVSGGQDLVVVGVSSPALEWALRDIPKVMFTSELPPTESPALVITPEQPDLALAAPYRGQRFVLREDTAWRLYLPQDWLRWFGFRTPPVDAQIKERIILWARTDLFPGDDASLLPGTQLPDAPGEQQEGPQ